MNFRRYLARQSLAAAFAQRKQAHPRRKHKIRRPVPPKALERKYEHALQPYLAKMHNLALTLLLPKLPGILAHVRAIRGDMRLDGPLEDAEAIFDEMRKQLDSAWGDQELGSLASTIGGDVSRYAQQQLREQLGDALGEQPFLAVTPGMDLAQRGFVKDNVRLIQSLSEKYFGELEGMVNDAVRSGSSTEDLAAQIEDRFDVTSNRAALIARDQVSKLNGDIAEAQQTDLGIESYTWRSSLDERVRPSHAALEGRVIRWDDPPEVGHPGEDFQCRCTPEPVIPEA